jgi:hypothetical protein
MNQPGDSEGFVAFESDEDSIRCSVRPEYKAAAFCTICRRPYSGRYLDIASDGRAVCHRCREDHDIPLFNPSDSKHDPALKEGVAKAITQVLLKPHELFEERWDGSPWPAIRFGLLISIVGLVFWNAWFWVFSADLADDAIQVVAERTGQQVSRDAVQAWSWFTLPIIAVLRLALGTLGLHLGFRLAGAPKRQFQDHVRLYALASCALILCIVPSWVGAFLANVAWLTTCMAFARVRYNFSMGRTLLALLPAIFVIFFFPPR